MKGKILTGLICFSMLSVMLFIPTGVQATSSMGPTTIIGTNTNWNDYPQIAMDAKGDAIAVWTQQGLTVDGTQLTGSYQYYLYGSRFTPENGWGEPRLLQGINSSTYGQSIIPAIAMNARGDAVVAWDQKNGTNGYLMSVRYDSVTGWGMPVKLTYDGPSVVVGNIQVAIDRNGNASAIHTLFQGSVYHLYGYYYTAATHTWSSWVSLESGSYSATSANVAMDGLGDAMVSFSQYNGSAYNIYVNRYTPIGGWAGPASIGSNITTADLPTIAMNNHGDAIVVWRQYDGANNSIIANKYTIATGWLGLATIDTRAEDATNPSIAMNDAGTAVFAWVQNVGNHWQPYSRQFSQAGWGPVSSIGPSPAYDAVFWLKITMDGQGNAMATWFNSTYVAYTNRYIVGPSTASWGTATVLATNAGWPEIAMNVHGDAFVIWQDGNLGKTLWAKGLSEDVNVTISNPTSNSVVYTPTIRVDGTATHASSLSINGHVVLVNSDGSYSDVIALLEGANTITVTAYNETWHSSASASTTVTFDNQDPILRQSIANTDANVSALNVLLGNTIANLHGAIAHLNDVNDLVNATSSDLNATKNLLATTRAQLQSVNAWLTLAYASENTTAGQLSALTDQVTAAQNVIIGLRNSLYSTDSNLTLSNADKSAISALLNQTITDLGTTKTNLATAQTSLKSTQNTQSNDETTYLLIGLVGIILAIVAIVLLFLKSKKPKVGQT